MSRLLRHSKVRHALKQLGIDRPETHPLYVSLLDLFDKTMQYSDNGGESNDNIFYVKTMPCSYRYKTPTGDRRKIDFIISKNSKHELSQMFISIMFMIHGLMIHRAVLTIHENTPLQLIRISEDFIGIQSVPEEEFAS